MTRYTILFKVKNEPGAVTRTAEIDASSEKVLTSKVKEYEKQNKVLFMEIVKQREI